MHQLKPRQTPRTLILTTILTWIWFKLKLETEIWNLNMKLEIETWKWISKFEIDTLNRNLGSQLLQYVCFQFANIAQFSMVKSWIEWFSALFDSQRMILELGIFQNSFHNLLIYTNNFCFGYNTVTCFFETFSCGWGWVVVGPFWLSADGFWV